MKVGFYFGKWIKIVEDKSSPRDEQFLTVCRDDWEIIKTLDGKYLVIVATILDTFDAKIINYGHK